MAEQSPAIDPGSVALILDLALKRHATLDSIFDTLNSRAGLLLGAASFISTSLLAALGENAIHPKAQKIMAGVLLSLFVLLTYFCKRVIDVQTVSTLPDAGRLAEDFATRPVGDTQLQVLAQLDDAYRKNEQIVKEKARNLRIGITLLVAEVAAIITAHLTGFLWGK